MSPMESDTMMKLLRQYGCGPIQFAGTDNAFYERHLIFDNIIELRTADARERFEAVARSVRDVLAQRWRQTEKTYARDNPKRVYYLSMEFLMGVDHTLRLQIDGHTLCSQCDEPVARSPYSRPSS